MKQLTMLLEKNIDILGDAEAEDKVWQFIIATRSNIAQCQNAKKVSLFNIYHILFMTIKTLTNL